MSVHDIRQLSESEIGCKTHNRVFRRPYKPIKAGDIVNLHLLDNTTESFVIEPSSEYGKCLGCAFENNSRLCCAYRKPRKHSNFCIFSEGHAVAIDKILEDL